MAVRLGTNKWQYKETPLKSDDLNDTFSQVETLARLFQLSKLDYRKSPIGGTITGTLDGEFQVFYNDTTFSDVTFTSPTGRVFVFVFGDITLENNIYAPWRTDEEAEGSGGNAINSIIGGSPQTAVTNFTAESFDPFKSPKKNHFMGGYSKGSYDHVPEGLGGGGSYGAGGNGDNTSYADPQVFSNGRGAIMFYAIRGTINIVGTIHAYGQNGMAEHEKVSGGGGGGCVTFFADTIDGTGTIDCSGGDGYVGEYDAHSGGGGGGFVGLFYKSNCNFNGTITVNGGASGGGSATAGEDGYYLIEQYDDIYF